MELADVAQASEPLVTNRGDRTAVGSPSSAAAPRPFMRRGVHTELASELDELGARRADVDTVEPRAPARPASGSGDRVISGGQAHLGRDRAPSVVGHALRLAGRRAATYRGRQLSRSTGTRAPSRSMLVIAPSIRTPCRRRLDRGAARGGEAQRRDVAARRPPS
jgi:hypothetical protein